MKRLFHHLGLKPGAQCLDIGCGTGNYTAALQQMGLQMTGVDPSEKMLETARSRDSFTQWKTGIAENIPLENAAVSGAVASLTIHHWTDLGKGFAELNRVLRPGARLVIFTSDPDQMRGYWLNHYFPRMLQDSMKQMPACEHVEKQLAQYGFSVAGTEKYFVRDDLQDLFLYSGKNRPAFYLDEQVRQGISSFSSLANADEVKTGLVRLQHDITTGKISEVIREHENNDGDYLFIIAERETAA